ncbi:MAG: DUF805 domain-containing protein [Pseudomonadota bacterium]
MFDLLFRLDYRIGRAKFWLGLITLILVGVVAEWVIVKLLFGVSRFELDNAAPQLQDFRYQIATALLWLILIYPNFAVLLKRCHDRNRSFWWLLPWFAVNIIVGILRATKLGYVTSDLSPFEMGLSLLYLLILLWFIVDLGLMPGTRGPNRFGPDPRDKSHQ